VIDRRLPLEPFHDLNQTVGERIDLCAVDVARAAVYIVWSPQHFL
jgi:hypothetical protein